MALSDFNTALNNSFTVTIDGIQVTHVTKVEGLKLEIDVVELKMNNEKGQFVNRKMPGRPKSGEVVIHRNYFAEDEVPGWMKDMFAGKLARKSGSIDEYDSMGNKLKSWQFKVGMLKAYEHEGLDAGANGPLAEKITIAHEGLEIG